MKLCSYIENHEKNQFTLIERHDELNEMSSSNAYEKRYLQFKLQQYFGDRMKIIYENRKATILTFLNMKNKVLRDHFKTLGLTPEKIVDMSSLLIDDQIC